MLDFPSSPINGQKFIGSNGVTYIWELGRWRSSGGGGGSGGTSVTTSDTPPISPFDGDLWWDSTLGKLFVWYLDPDGGQWVPASPMSSGAGDDLMAGQLTYTDASLTMTGSSQTLLAADPSRRALWIANREGNGLIHVNLSGAPAVVGQGLSIPAGGKLAWSGVETPIHVVTAIGTAGNVVNLVSGA